jgi:membrane associated rhomboid family serine protease
MIIPIGHESDKVRRLPWVSFFIIASCIFIFILTQVEINKRSKELERTAKEIVNYYVQHPYLKLDPETKKLLFGEKQNIDVEKILGTYRRRESRKIHLFQEEEQEKLDQLAQHLKDTINDVPYRKYGYIPAHKSLIGLVTYMFIHGGLLHLLGNLLLLYLTAPFIEDVWGRPFFAFFYLTAGIFSGFMFSLYHPHFTGPLIGASGAIAGLMGAFLIRYWKTKIKFFYIFFLLIRGTFKAPAWLMLPIWLALEIFNANAAGSVKGAAGGVAHWAHVWGFLFGVVVAFGMKYFRIEEKYIHPKIEAQVRFVDEGYKASEEAVQKINEGKPEEAYSLLLEAARKNPMNRDLVESLWSQAKELGKEKEAAEFYIRLIESEIRRNLMDVVSVHFMDLKERVPDASVNMTCKFMLMKYMTDQQDYKQAKKLASELIDEVGLDSSPGLLQSFAKDASEHSPEIAKKVIELCLKHPGITDEQKDELKTKLKDLQNKLSETPPASYGEEAHEAPRSEEQVTAELERQLGLSPGDELAVEPQGGSTIEPEGESAVELADEPVAPPEGQWQVQPEVSAAAKPPVQPPADTIGQPVLEPEGQPAVEPEVQPGVEPEIPAAEETEIRPEAEPQEDSAAELVDKFAVQAEGQWKAEPEGSEAAKSPVQPPADTIGEPVLEPEEQPAVEPEVQPGVEHEIPAAAELENQPAAGSENQSTPEPDKPERGSTPNHPIIAIKAIPLSMKDGTLELNMDQLGQQLLPLNKVNSIAVAEIAPERELPFLLIDLFLDDPKTNNHNVRTIRLLSTSFDPTKFSPGVQDHQDALKVFVSVLLRLSGATSYPDQDSILLEAPQSFFSIDDYEKSILS